jgi:cyclic beta-1,2-glucan synthetase
LLRASRLQLSVPTVTRFVDAYQERTPLTIAELWALPTFLRLGCLEVLFAAFERLDGSLRPPFTIDDMPDIALDDTECVGRAISNLRTIASISWKDFFCRTSRVEAILRSDPARMYQRMDFETRDAYRRASSAWLAAARIPSWRSLIGPWPAPGRLSEGPHGTRTSATGWWTRRVEPFERSIGYRPSFDDARAGGCFATRPILYATALVAATAATIVLPPGT